MNKIGFKNFRRFTEFQPIDLSGLTFLVGKNNSGKSTLVKALLLIIDYLKADNLKTLSFNQKNIEDVNIVTFDRALNRTAKINKEEFIEFLLELDGIRFQIILTGHGDSTIADVISFSIHDTFNGFSFNIKPNENSITIETSSTNNVEIPESERYLLAELEERKSEIIKSLNEVNEKLSQEYIGLIHELKQIRKKISDLRKMVRSKLNAGQFSLHSHFSNTSLRDVLQEAITEHFSEYEVQYHDIQRGKRPTKSFESLKSFRDSKFMIEKSVSFLLDFQSRTENIYLGATLNKQSALFAIRDSHNPLAQAIHEYKQLGIDRNQGSDAYKFVRDWMLKFEVGDSFEIVMHAGEAYEVVVNSGGLRIPLADKGMGSIQAMLLIVRFAVIIHRSQNNGKIYTVIIEEPELNLHPALQSILATFFHEVYEEYKVKLIVETHSEYLIRKTQLIVKNKEYEVAPNENPFTVIYFDKELTQWTMNYRSDGVFTENFGSGFFDVSSQQAISLFKKNK
ncbi:AAA domain-containing protein, putative AbiEii toxin, Type IV TA system [Dyadobacter koreensis]|uniref:AAA domain-containing protein, putative AbiEii toxin, Type IV TA system n=1 Tax=Dyadobacter koreensis TaxID=408657 RepID=A0A1H6YWM2_9BACT|nr:AAA family ATPase [Dyadobacter koreensis]SEJ41762.1 AAA domain-containing protein, putative AbiEii toxin, Type IV TA system [Dyadobacter koreensis]